MTQGIRNKGPLQLGIYVGLCGLSLWLSATRAADNIPALGVVPANIAVDERTSLTQRRQALEIQRSAFQAAAAEFNGKTAENQTDAEYNAVDAQRTQYIAAVTAFNIELAAAQSMARNKEPTESCKAAARQVEKDRQEIERARHNTEASQEELRDWGKLNDESQDKAIEAGIKFVAGEYVANLGSVRSSVSKLEDYGTFLAKKATQSRKYQTRIGYLTQLEAALVELEPLQTTLVKKEAVNAVVEGKKGWEVLRDSVHGEVRVAIKHNEAIRTVLKNPKFKDAFIGPDIDTPALDVLSTLVEQAGDDLGKMELGLEGYEKMTGPTIRAFVFVRDALYSAILSGVSTARVLQQADQSTDLAKAAGVLQARYKQSIDALNACR